MIKVNVMFNGYSANSGVNKLKNGKATIELSEGLIVRDLLNMLDIPQDEPILVLINDILSDIEIVLEDGDYVTLLPLLFGG